MKPNNLPKLIHESNLIEGINSPGEDEQSHLAWEYLSTQKKLSNMVVCKTQRLIVKNQTDLATKEKGHYRDLTRQNVYVGSYMAPNWAYVKAMMDDWVWMYEHMTADALGLHIRFEKIHPFVDGNGRTGRMLLWWMEMKAGGQPTLFKAVERQTVYYPLFDKKRI